MGTSSQADAVANRVTAPTHSENKPRGPHNQVLAYHLHRKPTCTTRISTQDIRRMRILMVAGPPTASMGIHHLRLINKPKRMLMRELLMVMVPRRILSKDRLLPAMLQEHNITPPAPTTLLISNHQRSRLTITHHNPRTLTTLLNLPVDISIRTIQDMVAPPHRIITPRRGRCVQSLTLPSPHRPVRLMNLSRRMGKVESRQHLTVRARDTIRMGMLLARGITIPHSPTPGMRVGVDIRRLRMLGFLSSITPEFFPQRGVLEAAELPDRVEVEVLAGISILLCLVPLSLEDHISLRAELTRRILQLITPNRKEELGAMERLHLLDKCPPP